MGEPLRNVALCEGQRFTIRTAPSVWTAPPRSELSQRINKLSLGFRVTDGDWGLNGDGALSVWRRIAGARKEMDVTDAKQWFRSDGELLGREHELLFGA